MKRIFSLILVLALALPALALADSSAREEMIDDILALAEKKFDEAGGRAPRAQ